MTEIKSGNAIIRVQKTEFKGKEYIDVRKFYQGENEEWLPTKKGISIPIDLVKEVIKAINSL